MLLNLLVRLIQFMISIICLLFLFVASITRENAFVCLHLIVMPSRCVCSCNWYRAGWCKHMRCSWSVRKVYHKRCMPKTNIEIIQVHITSFGLLCIMLSWSWMFIAQEIFHEGRQFMEFQSSCVSKSNIGVVWLASPSTCKSHT
jgi:hypothetical protein